MSFLYPIFIYLMLPVMLLLFYLVMTRNTESLAYFDKDVLQKLRLHSRGLGRNARYTLFLLSFVLMIVALAQPVIKEGEVTVEARSADILVAIDISDSMKAEDFYPNRLEFAKNKAIELIKKAPHNRIGVLAFARHDYIVSPLSFDHSSVAFLLSKVRTDNITEKGTHFDSMLHSAASMLSHAKTKNLLLFTDGGDSSDFAREISLAKEMEIRLFVIGVGSEQGSPVKAKGGGFVKHEGNILISALNPALKNLATQTGGVYIESVLSNEDITAMLFEIEAIAEKSSLKEETIPRYTQLFYYPLGLAVFILLLAFSSVPRAKNLLLLGLLFVSLPEAKAGLFDFKKLAEAKEAYADEDYGTSAELYETLAEGSPEAAYNYANSLYKAQEYEKALQAYDTITADVPELKAKVLHNSGNAHAKLQQYQEALSAYEEALKLGKDTQTQENYERVKQLLEEQEKEKEESDADDKQEKEESEEQEKDPSKKSEQKSDQKEDSSEKDEQKSEKSAEEAESEDTEAQEKEEEEKEAQKNEKSENEAASQKSEEEKAEEAPTQAQSEAEQLPLNAQQMSDLEAEKWLKVLRDSQKGHLYKMQESEHKGDENEKPW